MWQFCMPFYLKLPNCSDTGCVGYTKTRLYMLRYMKHTPSSTDVLVSPPLTTYRWCWGHNTHSYSAVWWKPLLEHSCHHGGRTHSGSISGSHFFAEVAGAKLALKTINFRPHKFIPLSPSLLCPHSDFPLSQIPKLPLYWPLLVMFKQVILGRQLPT